MDSLSLRELTSKDEDVFADALAKSTDPSFDFALLHQERENFSAYLKRLRNRSRGVALPPHHVAEVLYFAFLQNSMSSEKIVGRLSFRSELNVLLLRIGGHMGYGVLPKYRGKDHATAMLRHGVEIARKKGLKRVLLTCRNGNIASQKTIEACGGLLENLVMDVEGDTELLERRYWIHV